ncbi:uncharacterized protein LOC124257052 [Haliotis rubra]|uniref:uncharacterized protein LOC124257052 n=1 Tax=Haliotis rubra TaxID=36100 RepID=UPI001EE5855E|nr:uncharacterized protein LOC124257052 [Haliotis rubra]
MEDITVAVVPCIIGVILVTCGFTIKRRKLISGHNSSTDVNVSSPERKPADKEGSEPFYANVDDLKPDPGRPVGVRSSHTNTKRKKGTRASHAVQSSRCMPEIQSIVSDTCSIDSSEDGGEGHQSEHSISPSSIYCNTQNLTSDTAIYSNCSVDRSQGSVRLIQPDHYTYLDTVHRPMEAGSTQQSDIYVNTNVPAQGGSTEQPDKSTYLDPLPGSSVLGIQSESDLYDLPYAFTRNRNVPVSKHDHYVNIFPAKKETKKKKKKSNKKR